MMILDTLLYGVAYYDEYMPYDRLDEDIRMMKAAGINVVRVAESTWSTWEPQNGVFDFSRLDRVLDAMERAEISVIVGTPTYAFPPWLAKEHPEVLAVTKTGRERYGRRQNMDITSPVYLFYAERAIRQLLERTVERRCVIGFQIDNETKHYDTAGDHVQMLFVKYLKGRFGTTDALNRAFGLDYWSNRIGGWEDFPDVRGTINGSLGAEFEKFQRTLVDNFLGWQADLIREYKRSDQFITHNFDYSWVGHSYGVQPHVNHRTASRCLDIAGCDIYHPAQDDLTGVEISFGGDLCRSLKDDNYLVLETQAQGFPQWVPYPGQLRLQAFSHLAGGAAMVEYWHWHSIHNSLETYWKGLLSHDFQENPTYREAVTIGADFQRLSESLVGLRKENDVAILVSNESLTALDWFPIDGDVNYNTVVRWCYDQLYRMNVGVDFLFPDAEELGRYKLIVAPALYAAPDSLLEHLAGYVKDGGHLLATFKTGFADENVQVRADIQPGLLSDCLGIRYSQFTVPNKVGLNGLELPPEQAEVRHWMELVTPVTAEVLASYEHPVWREYAAVTRNRFGKGTAAYMACFAGEEALAAICEELLQSCGLYGPEQQVRFPIIIKKGVNRRRREVVFYLNFSAEKQSLSYLHFDGRELLAGNPIRHGDMLRLDPWGLAIIEED